jgi:hypothetical protein
MELTGSKLPETLPLDTWRGSGKTSVVWVSRKQMEIVRTTGSGEEVRIQAQRRDDNDEVLKEGTVLLMPLEGYGAPELSKGQPLPADRCDLILVHDIGGDEKPERLWYLIWDGTRWRGQSGPFLRRFGLTLQRPGLMVEMLAVVPPEEVEAEKIKRSKAFVESAHAKERLAFELILEQMRTMRLKREEAEAEAIEAAAASAEAAAAEAAAAEAAAAEATAAEAVAAEAAAAEAAAAEAAAAEAAVMLQWREGYNPSPASATPVWRDENRTLVAPPKASLRQDPGMVHSGECTPGCTCYQQIEHCREWDPTCAPRCHCEFHLELTRAAEALAKERALIRDEAFVEVNERWGQPPPYVPRSADCVNDPFGVGGCRCAPVVEKGNSCSDQVEELARLTARHFHLLRLGLENEVVPFFPSHLRNRRHYPPPSDFFSILREEFECEYELQMGKRNDERANGHPVPARAVVTHDLRLPVTTRVKEIIAAAEAAAAEAAAAEAAAAEAAAAEAVAAEAAAAEASWSYSDALCDGAWDYAWGEPPQPGSMEGSVCVLSGTKKCSCTPGGPGGCYPEPS